MSKSIAEEMRVTIRESLLDPTKTSGPLFKAIEPLMTPKQRHDRKKKFLNEEETIWWVGENVNEEQRDIQRPYKCKICPFWHLTTKAKWEK